MIPRSPASSESKRDRALRAQLAAISERLEATERQQQQLKNTITALGREVGVSVGCPCGRCNESYMLIKQGSMYCPRCGHRGAV
ncbi:hypothetical protein [Natrinema marinum]|uniref:hypothetical protein n=1 Tax=Natrinema marinum TaxID=2961598 RepID=UPI0020C88E29|nr:hypothetical protein [Natrinema marinum]